MKPRDRGLAPPPGLGRLGQQAWRDAITDMRAAGYWERMFRPALELYAHMIERVAGLEALVRAHGAAAPMTGPTREHDTVGEQLTAERRVLFDVAESMGFTPKSRRDILRAIRRGEWGPRDPKGAA